MWSVRWNSIIEVEIKIPLTSEGRSAIEESIVRIGGISKGVEYQSDRYYNHPCRDFATTDEAVRLRELVVRSPDSDRSVRYLQMTYKGPKIDPLSKTRDEVTMEVSDLEAADTILRALSFRFVREVRKKRSTYQIGDISVCVDDVDGLGSFVELECVTSSRAGVTDTRERLFSLASQLGLDTRRATRESYLSLLMRARQ